MAYLNSATLYSMVGVEYKKIEGGKDVPFWPDDPWLSKAIKNATEFGYGEGADAAGESFRVPFEIDGNITTTVSSSYKATITAGGEDVVVASVMGFNYQWVDQNLLIYKQEVNLSDDPQALVHLRTKNAISSYKKKVLWGMLNDDGAPGTEIAGFQSIWYDTTYGGVNRATYAERLDCASAIDKFAGGNGTKFTQAIVRDGKTLYEWLVASITATMFNGQAVTDIFVDQFAFGAILQYLGDRYLVGNSGPLPVETDAGRMKLRLVNNTIVHCADTRLMPVGQCYGICVPYLAIYSAKNTPLIPDGPFAEAPYTGKAGAKTVMFQGSGRLVSMWPTANFWFTQFGLG